VAEHRIEQDGDGLSITVEGVKDQKEQLLEAFQECQEGRCSCPTNEYQKLETLEIKSDEDSVHLLLTAREGESFDREEIEKCLEYTEGRVMGGPCESVEGDNS